MIFWTPERIAELRRLRALGWSYAEVARALGCTRNAALSKGQRLEGRHLVGGNKPKRRRHTAAIPNRWADEHFIERWVDRHARRP